MICVVWDTLYVLPQNELHQEKICRLRLQMKIENTLGKRGFVQHSTANIFYRFCLVSLAGDLL